MPTKTLAVNKNSARRAKEAKRGRTMTELIAGKGDKGNITLRGETSAIKKLNDRPKHTIHK